MYCIWVDVFYSHVDVPYMPMLPPDLEQAIAHDVPHAGHSLRGAGLHRRLRLAHSRQGRQRASQAHP